MHKAALFTCVLFIALHSLAQTADFTERRDRTWPADATVSSQRAPFVPMTQEERLHYYFKTTFSLESALRCSFGAGISQWQNTPSEWGQGMEGYGKRIGNSYAQHMIRQTLMYGASSILHEDNRYILSRKSGVGPRLRYAVASSFLARRDDGTQRVSYSRLGSYAATAFISREWQPHSNNGAQNAIASFENTIVTTVSFNIAREFLPKVFHRHND
jgi:hypothetical protein